MGAARFVLSGSHYMEVTKIRDPTQRRALADVTEELTDFAVLVSRVVIMNWNSRRRRTQFVVAVPPLPAVALVGRGVRHAVGIKSGLRVVGRNGDATGQVRERMGAEQFDALVANANLDSPTTGRTPHGNRALDATDGRRVPVNMSLRNGTLNVVQQRATE